MEKAIEKTLKHLKARGFTPWNAEDAGKARDIMLDLIPKHARVGRGNSSTLEQIEIIQALEKRGTPVFIPSNLMSIAVEGEDPFITMFRKMLASSLCDVYVSGTNAVTQDGRLVNIDGAGNRVAGMFWGHPLVILVAGKNKIVKDLDEANDRLKNVIVHEHAKRHLKGDAVQKPPCVEKGRCIDCIGPDRICNITTIMEGKPFFSEVHVIIVNEDLGLSWNPSWPQDRIDGIISKHEQKMWPAHEGILDVDVEALWKSVKDQLSQMT